MSISYLFIHFAANTGEVAYNMTTETYRTAVKLSSISHGDTAREQKELKMLNRYRVGKEENQSILKSLRLWLGMHMSGNRSSAEIEHFPPSLLACKQLPMHTPRADDRNVNSAMYSEATSSQCKTPRCCNEAWLSVARPGLG